MFQNVVMADAGDYQCQASNKFAQDITSSRCKMQIRRKNELCTFIYYHTINSVTMNSMGSHKNVFHIL